MLLTRLPASRVIRCEISFPTEIGPITDADPTRCHAKVAIARTVDLDININQDINTVQCETNALRSLIIDFRSPQIALRD